MADRRVQVQLVVPSALTEGDYADFLVRLSQFLVADPSSITLGNEGDYLDDVAIEDRDRLGENDPRSPRNPL